MGSFHPFLSQDAITWLDGLNVKVLSCVADGAANIQRALANINARSNIIQLRCLAHSCELLAKDLAGIYPDAIQRAAAIEAYFRVHHYARLASFSVRGSTFSILQALLY
jgi:hypothetical protein